MHAVLWDIAHLEHLKVRDAANGRYSKKDREARLDYMEQQLKLHATELLERVWFHAFEALCLNTEEIDAEYWMVRRTA
jgi:hypothetical protein